MDGHFPPSLVLYVQNPSSPQSAAPQVAVSSGEPSGLTHGRNTDLLAKLRTETPARWMRFLQAHFQGPSHVAYFFNVDEKTGRNWWEGAGRPSADKLLAAQTLFPGSYQHFMLAA